MVARSPAKQMPKELVDRLVASLKGPFVLDEPFVIEDRIPQTHSRHVVVIWDAWSDFDRATRSAVIMDAFQTAGTLDGDVVRVALGLTQQEAFEMGYLPFMVETARRKTDSVDPERLREALDTVGGIHIRTGASHQLRFPSREYAEEAYRQLAEKVPGPYWVLVQEVAPPEPA